MIAYASWGTGMYGEDAGGIARRTLFFDTATGDWWDQHPLDGTTVNKNKEGPYNGHPIRGLYRPVKSSSESELEDIAPTVVQDVFCKAS